MAGKKQGMGIFGLRAGSVKLSRKSNVAGLLKALLFVCSFVLVLAGFAFLDGYVKKQTTGSSGNRTIELVGDVPNWVSEEIKNRIYAAATAEANNSANNDEIIAASAQRNIAQSRPLAGRREGPDHSQKHTHHGTLAKTNCSWLPPKKINFSSTPTLSFSIIRRLVICPL